MPDAFKNMQAQLERALAKAVKDTIATTMADTVATLNENKPSIFTHAVLSETGLRLSFPVRFRVVARFVTVGSSRSAPTDGAPRQGLGL